MVYLLGLMVVGVNLALGSGDGDYLLKASFYENGTWRKIWILTISIDGNAHLRYTPNASANFGRTIEIDLQLEPDQRAKVEKVVAEIEQGLLDHPPGATYTDGPVFWLMARQAENEVSVVTMYPGPPHGDPGRLRFLDACDQLSGIVPRYRVDPRKYEWSESNQNQVVEPTPAVRAPKFGRGYR